MAPFTFYRHRTRNSSDCRCLCYVHHRPRCLASSRNPEGSRGNRCLQRLLNKTYVVFISEVILDLLTFYAFNFLNCFGSIASGLYAPWNPHNECIIHFILQKEPKSNPEECMESSLSVPIVPMTIEAHPSSRNPLKPTSPLPWNDCYYLSCFFFTTLGSPTSFATERIK
jgi:hypothetical protein